jgi:hypothetical protein
MINQNILPRVTHSLYDTMTSELVILYLIPGYSVIERLLCTQHALNRKFSQYYSFPQIRRHIDSWGQLFIYFFDMQHCGVLDVVVVLRFDSDAVVGLVTGVILIVSVDGQHDVELDTDVVARLVGLEVPAFEGIVGAGPADDTAPDVLDDRSADHGFEAGELHEGSGGLLAGVAELGAELADASLLGRQQLVVIC